MPDSDDRPAEDRGDASSDATEIRPPSESDSGSGAAKVRFTPGSMLAGRYRIVALLGKGGMGEVYRAEDVKLGQQVALKFLPREFAKDEGKLRRLYEEVRLGRQVSHPNVCRMYDISEWDGHHFISMEYIDGEDLGSLLRRIGKLPNEKAIDIARDLCAGLAAAHGLGIVHRDLKPANVMIDGRGDARITDFGLAALAEDLEKRREVAGTPAYMAPEQLEGGAVTTKTDLYSLGLIFYEMFTGKRLFEGKTFGEIVSQHKTSSSSSLSRETSSLDVAVQKVMVRCLEEDPARRPGSIHSVIAALPGGDPLQAALDAGETPSPEMVAAAGSSGELSPAVAWPLVILTIIILVATAAVSPRVRLYGQTDLPLEPYELAVRARSILEDLGQTERPLDTAWGMGVDSDYRYWKRDENRAGNRHSEQLTEWLSPLWFGYRESPALMQVTGVGRVNPFESVPALDVGGMAQLILEPDGRLRRVVIVPPERIEPESSVAETSMREWGRYFDLAGLKLDEAEAVEPVWRPPVASDQRKAWEVSVRELEEPIRVEAASFLGQPVWFEVIAPWKQPFEPRGAYMSPSRRLGEVLFLGFILVSIVVGVFLANRNLRRGRGDRAGASRIAVFIFIASMATFIGVDHYWSAAHEADSFFPQLAFSIFGAALTWVWYMALEPYLRRRWPRTLISWSRLLQKRWLDPLVGRDVMVGVLAGASVMLVEFLMLAVPDWLGWTPPIPWDTSALDLTGWRYSLEFLAQNLMVSVLLGIFWMMVLLIAHLVFRNRGAAIVIVFILWALTDWSSNYPVLELISSVTAAAVVTWVMTRHGLLALATVLLTRYMFNNFPTTLDPTVWYFDRSIFVLALLIGLAVFGFTRSLGEQAVFGEPVLED